MGFLKIYRKLNYICTSLKCANISNYEQPCFRINISNMPCFKQNNVQVLVEAGADFSLKDKWGDTALDLAERHRAKEAVAVIREHYDW